MSGEKDGGFVSAPSKQMISQAFSLYIRVYFQESGAVRVNAGEEA